MVFGQGAREPVIPMYGVDFVKKFLLANLFILILAAQARAENPAPEKAITIPPLPYKHATLANGLEIFSVEDHTSPTVGVQVWYHVGAKDDPNGRSGFAHLFEHMMFKGNEHLKEDTFDELTENIGGENNAYTQEDVTVYHEVVPANYLNPILWAEAERMSSLALNEPNFKSERAVVEEEYRQRISANPYGEFFLDLDRKSFAVHPYKRTTIGSIEDLEAAKLPEVRAFHSTFYRPDNATLIVVGDFQQANLDGWIRKYFEPIKKPAEKIPRVSVQEPARKKELRDVSYSPKAPLPALAVTYLAPSIRSADAPALLLAEEIFAGGDSSRLYQSLVYEQQIAQNVSCNADLREDLGLLSFRVILASGKSVTDAEKSLRAQIDDVLKNGVTDAELAKAKNRFLTAKLLERETMNGKASALGLAVVLYGDATRANTELARVQAVTTAQVKEALIKCMAGKKEVVLEFLPEAMRAKTPEAGGKKSR